MSPLWSENTFNKKFYSISYGAKMVPDVQPTGAAAGTMAIGRGFRPLRRAGETTGEIRPVRGATGGAAPWTPAIFEKIE